MTLSVSILSFYSLLHFIFCLMNFGIKYIEGWKEFVPMLMSQYCLNECILVISGDKLFFSLNILKHHIACSFKMLSCISGVDLIHELNRFIIVYDLISFNQNSRLRIKVFINEATSLMSIVNLYINSSWWEREIWDMYGVFFDEHPDLRRILTDYGFEGHPLRKDFPLSGYVEIKYSNKKQRIVVEPLGLSQDFRHFSFDTPWFD